jgi:DNA-binding PadR family transcriptional regulator
MSARLFVLGFLMKGSAHGYEIKKRLQEWKMEEWTDFNWSSVYHALKQMEKEGLIEKKTVKENSGRPAKDVYTIRNSGEKEFFEILRGTCVEASVEKHPIYIALMFLHSLPEQERLSLLQKRLGSLLALQQRVLKKRQLLQGQPRMYEEALLSVDRDLNHRKAEIAWTHRLIEYYRHCGCDQ